MSAPDSSDARELEFSRVESVLDGLLLRDRDVLESNEIIIPDFACRCDRRNWPIWSVTFRRKWPIHSEFGLVTVNVTYQFPASDAKEPVRLTVRAEIFQTGVASRFDHREETVMSVEEFCDRDGFNQVLDAVERASRDIQVAATGQARS